jgi:hypothetical protein
MGTTEGNAQSLGVSGSVPVDSEYTPMVDWNTITAVSFACHAPDFRVSGG